MSRQTAEYVAREAAKAENFRARTDENRPVEWRPWEEFRRPPDITFKVLGPDGDRPEIYPVDPLDPSTLEVADEALAAFLARGQTALVPGVGQITEIDRESVPAEVLIVVPMVGG